MSIPNNYRAEIGIEAAFGDGLGGGAFTPIPFTFDSIPDLKKTDTVLPVIGGSKAGQPSYPDEPYWEMPFKCYLKGSGTAGTASELGKLFRAAGLKQTVNAGTSCTYDAQDDSYESVSIKVNTDGTLRLLAGGRVTQWKIPLIAGKRTQLEGTIWGLYAAPTAVAYSAPTFADAAVTIPIVQSLALTIAGNTHVIPEVTFTLNNNAEKEPNVNSANGGINDWAYGTRDWQVEIIAKRDATNDIEFWTAHDASTMLAFASGGYGAAGNKTEWDMSNIQLTSIKEVTRVGQIYYQVTAGIKYHATLASEFRMKQT